MSLLFKKFVRSAPESVILLYVDNAGDLVIFELEGKVRVESPFFNPKDSTWCARFVKYQWSPDSGIP